MQRLGRSLLSNSPSPHSVTADIHSANDVMAPMGRRMVLPQCARWPHPLLVHQQHPQHNTAGEGRRMGGREEVTRRRVCGPGVGARQKLCCDAIRVVSQGWEQSSTLHAHCVSTANRQLTIANCHSAVVPQVHYQGQPARPHDRLHQHPRSLHLIK